MEQQVVTELAPADLSQEGVPAPSGNPFQGGCNLPGSDLPEMQRGR